jgi:hypothetical protein
LGTKHTSKAALGLSGAAASIASLTSAPTIRALCDKNRLSVFS